MGREITQRIIQQQLVEGRRPTVGQLKRHLVLQLRTQRALGPHHQEAPIRRLQRERLNLITEKHPVHVVGFLPAAHELPFNALGLPRDHVLDGAHLVVLLRSGKHFLKHRIQQPASPIRVLGFQLVLAKDRRIPPVDHPHHFAEEQRFTTAVHIRMEQQRGIQLGTHILQRVRQPPHHPVGGFLIVVAQVAQQIEDALALLVLLSLGHLIRYQGNTGEGIDELLESITLTAEMIEIKAVVNKPARGVVLEARLDKGRGKVTTVLVQSGTLRKGDIVIAGLEYGKIKQIVDDKGRTIKKAGPSTPVEILGLSGVPDSGAEALAVESERKAREVADFRKTKDRETKLQKQQAEKMDNFFSKMEEGEVATVNVLLKSDVHGSAQALVEAIEELSTEEVKVRVVSSGVGAISNTDISLASTSDAIVLGFNVRADAVARKTADTEGVRIEYYSVIYNLIDDLKAIMGGMLSPEFSENIIGIASVKDVFKSPKFGDIAGCIVDEGVVKKDSPIRVLRESVVIYEGELESLRRFKDDVKEVKSGTECGIGVLNYTDVQPGDQIEVFERIERARKL